MLRIPRIAKLTIGSFCFCQRICLFIAVQATLSLSVFVTVSADLDVIQPNGVSDVWEAVYSISEPSQNEDTDGDGVNDLDEALNGTNPHDPDSSFKLNFLRHEALSSVLSWEAKVGRRYQIQRSYGSGDWTNFSYVIEGHGAEASVPVDTKDPLYQYRVMAIEDPALPEQARALLSARDTDADGDNDWLEWIAGSSVIDPSNPFEARMEGNQPTAIMSWSTVAGQTYELETLLNGVWTVMAGPFYGTGQNITHAVQSSAGAGLFRLRAEKPDSDGDGLTDWEEHLLGIDHLDSQTHDYQSVDMEWAIENLSFGGQFELETVKPVAREGTAYAIVRLRRVGGRLPVSVALQVSGDWVQEPPGPIEMGLDQDEAEILFYPSAGAGAGSVKIISGAGYTLGKEIQRPLISFEERLINVALHGALGDGVSDDTSAILRAITHLEEDTSYNGLYFPEGRYVLGTVIQDGDSPLGNKRLLALGYDNDLTNRDLLIKGASGACLYSKVSPERANMMIIKGGFRSITFENIRFEQDSEPLKAAPGFEPNGSDGVTISADSLRVVESISFYNCEFVNCHRAVSVYGVGYDIRGNCRSFLMHDCKILNPHGANTQNSETAWGGGQQIYLAAWVGEAQYLRCLFDGGGTDLGDPETSPGGRVKDGCHFGSPMRLVFRNNTVLRMGVEALHQTNETTLMSRTLSDFVMPLPDNSATSEVHVSNFPTTWVPGEWIHVKSPGTPHSSPSSNWLTIHSYDQDSSTLVLSNPNHPQNIAAGTVITAGRKLYLDERPEATVALIEGNYFNGVIPTGGRAFNEQGAVVLQSQALVRSNVITNYGNGIRNRVEAHTPRHPAGYGIRVAGNIIITRRSIDFPETGTNGIMLADGKEKVYDNLVILPISWKTVGIAFHGVDSNAWNNTIVADEIRVNGYNTKYRATGIGNMVTGPNLSTWDNSTRGFDVGVGPLVPHTWTPFRAKRHASIQDVLPLDLRGLQPW